MGLMEIVSPMKIEKELLKEAKSEFLIIKNNLEKNIGLLLKSKPLLEEKILGISFMGYGQLGTEVIKNVDNRIWSHYDFFNIKYTFPFKNIKIESYFACAFLVSIEKNKWTSIEETIYNTKWYNFEENSWTYNELTKQLKLLEKRIINKISLNTKEFVQSSNLSWR